ncbi:hypothetical protein EBB07_10290 [Paenibacillaceae bacterium]|nr:hypothetical protein EBB07_10290 [Paenibacillaceae bacterium]
MNIRVEAEQLRKDIEEEQNIKLKIALFGQPGAGKSSLINRIVGHTVALTGVSTDMTTEAKLIEHEELLFVDLPGYGTSRFPPNKWMEEFKPEELDLFLCVFSGKFHEADTRFFKELRAKGRICLFIRNKHDDLWEDGKTTAQLEEDITGDVQKQLGESQPVHFVSCRNGYGLEGLVNAIYGALDPAKQDKYALSAKAYSMDHLAAKRAACEKMVYKFAGVAAANGLNPIPGVNIGVDISIMMKLFTDLRKSYGLSDEKVNKLIPSLLPLGKQVLEFSSKEGIIMLLKRYSGKETGRQLGRFVPIIGQAIAAAAGFGMTLAAGRSYLNDCHRLAEQILAEELKPEGK